jgi:dihydrofolate reductase
VSRKRRIIVYIATSADGYIARSDGNIDWLNRPRTAGNYGTAAFFGSIDTILWGRRTYDEGLARGGGGVFGLRVKNYVFTHDAPEASTPGVEFVTEPVAEFARRLRARRGKDIMMMGGAGAIGSFLDAGQIDDFIIHVIPTFLGEGIPLLQPRARSVKLTLASSRRFSDGVVHLHYKVLPTPVRATR